MNIVFDIGGTKMRVAAAEGIVLGEIQKVPTPHSPQEAISTLAALAKEEARGRQIEHIAGGIAGVIKDGILFWEPNLPGEWAGVHLADELTRALGAPARVVNDTALVGLGEAHEGAGKGKNLVVYITVSTGVGGARIDGGEIDHAVYGFEIGHQLVNGLDLEKQVSGTAVKNKFGIDPWDLDSLDERTKLADILAHGLFNTTLHWSPNIIVLGGSMITGKNPIPLDRVEATLTKMLYMYPHSPEMKMAALGDNGGLVGGAILAAQMR